MNPRILFCASEAVPFSQTGGLADVIGSLAGALHDSGCDVRIYLPLYRETRNKLEDSTLLAENIPLEVGSWQYSGHFWATKTKSGIPVYLLEKDEFFDRSYLYGNPRRGDYEDNPQRFIALCRSAYTLVTKLGWYPEIMHLHDWQTALIAAYLHFQWRYDRQLSTTRSLFTIHNLGYQGIYPASSFRFTGLPREAFTIHGMEFWGQCNFIKAGLKYADRLTTVSPQYSLEIQQPEFGFGLDEDLRARRQDLVGILNGIDDVTWNPGTDPRIERPYDADHLPGKRQCKQALLWELGFSPKTGQWPLLAMVGRLAAQKGLDLVQEILPELMTGSLAMVILGNGDPAVASRLEAEAAAHPDRLKVVIGFDEELAHKIEAGADLFLMPSRYEPCGLNQMYSLRYGTIPVVHAVGGLDDSVTDVLKDPAQGTGFKFYRYTGPDFLASIQAALRFFQDPAAWRKIQQRAMRQDFSWKQSARKYLEQYQKLRSRG